MQLLATLTAEREEILRRFEARVRAQHPQAPPVDRSAVLNDLPRFLDRVVATVQSSDGVSRLGPSLESAGNHGKQRQELGVDIQSLVREYGILRDVVIEILVERDQRVDVEEFRAWSNRIDEAACEAVTQYAQQRDEELATERGNDLAFLAHELRNQLAIAMATMALAKRREYVSPSDLVNLDEALRVLNQILDREIMSERLRAVDAGVALQSQALDLRMLANTVAVSVASLAATRDITLAVQGDEAIVTADPRLLLSALSNLVTNAIKFSCDGGHVAIRTSSTETAVRLEVEDQCGGLGPDAISRIGVPWAQIGTNRSGFGLGLAIARRAIEAHNGRLDMRDLPDIGCIFTIDLPRSSP